MRTYTPKPGEITRQWHVVDATDVVLGRLASQVAALLRGKHKATFAPHVDTGDFVIVVNADKVALTGAKAEKKRAGSGSPQPSPSTGPFPRFRTPSRPPRRTSRRWGRRSRGFTPRERRGRVTARGNSPLVEAAPMGMGGRWPGGVGHTERDALAQSPRPHRRHAGAGGPAGHPRVRRPGSRRPPHPRGHRALDHLGSLPHLAAGASGPAAGAACTSCGPRPAGEACGPGLARGGSRVQPTHTHAGGSTRGLIPTAITRGSGPNPPARRRPPRAPRRRRRHR